MIPMGHGPWILDYSFPDPWTSKFPGAWDVTAKVVTQITQSISDFVGIDGNHGINFFANRETSMKKAMMPEVNRSLALYRRYLRVSQRLKASTVLPLLVSLPFSRKLELNIKILFQSKKHVTDAKLIDHWQKVSRLGCT